MYGHYKGKKSNQSHGESIPSWMREKKNYIEIHLRLFIYLLAMEISKRRNAIKEKIFIIS